MGVFSFAKDIGDKLFHRNKKQDAAQPTAAPAATPAEEPTAQEIANLLLARIQAQNVNISGLKVNYNGDTDTVTLSGVAKTQADRERARLAVGNAKPSHHLLSKLWIARASPRSARASLTK